MKRPKRQVSAAGTFRQIPIAILAVVDIPYRRWPEWQRFRRFRKFAEAVGLAALLGRPGPFRHRRHGEGLYRFAKQAAQERGDYTAAGQYHYAEQCAIEDGRRCNSQYRPWRKNLWLWIGRLIFGRLIFGYGEKPWHPLLIGLGVILAWACFYAHFDAVAPGHLVRPESVEAYELESFTEALHFSIVTFTTLGYGDYKPKPAYRLVADVEAALGAALMATFVVCLTRKYMR